MAKKRKTSELRSRNSELNNLVMEDKRLSMIIREKIKSSELIHEQELQQ